MAHDPRIQKLLDSRNAGELERRKQIEIGAAEAWWQSLTDEQREAYAALGHDGWFYIEEKIRKARQR
jgi:hypothetical protein